MVLSQQILPVMHMPQSTVAPQELVHRSQELWTQFAPTMTQHGSVQQVAAVCDPWNVSQNPCVPQVALAFHWLVSATAAQTSRLIELTQRMSPGTHGPQRPRPKHTPAHAG